MKARWSEHQLTWRAPSAQEQLVALRRRPPMCGPMDVEEMKTMARRLADRLGVKCRLRVSATTKNLGSCKRAKDGVFDITLSTMNVSMTSAVETLIHELAHAVAWEKNIADPIGDHGPSWGVAYSRVYEEFQRFRP